MKVFTKSNLIVIATILCISMIMSPSLLKADYNEKLNIPVSMTWDDEVSNEVNRITISLKPKTGENIFTNFSLYLLLGAIAGMIITGYKLRKQF